MKRDWIIGALFSLAGLAALTYSVIGQSDFPISEWLPEAFNGLVFSFVIGFGLSETIATAYAVFNYITVITVCFAVGHKVSRLLFSSTK